MAVRAESASAAASVFIASSRPPTTTKGRQSFDEDWERGERTRQREVVRLAVARVVAGVLGAAGYHLDVRKAERRGGLDQEGRLALVGLQQGQRQVGPGQAQRKARQPAAASDIDDPEPSRRQEVEEDERVLEQRAVGPSDQPRPR